jgi:mutual gliding-motility protein MglA
MAEIDQRNRTLRVKLVYYGPPLGGKTTNLVRLHELAGETHRGEMISINSRQDRTILFDLLPLTTVGPRGFELRLQVVAVPGQPVYAATRRAVLRGADGVVFVANSASDRWQETLDSFDEMKRHLIDHGIDPTAVPLAIQYNKRDLPLVTPMDEMDVHLRARGESPVPAVATTGEGVIETFETILTRTLSDLTRRFRVLEIDGGRTPEHLAREIVMGLFGRSPDQERGSRVVPVTIDTNGGGVGMTAPTPGRKRRPIVEVYAEACEELAVRLTAAKAERDEAQGTLAEVRRALDIVGELNPWDLAATVKRMLACLSESAGAAGASFALVTPDGFGRALSLPGAENLLLDAPGGRRYLMPLVQGGRAVLRQNSEDVELWALLGGGERSLGALVAVPLRTTSGMLGLVVLYFREDGAVPTPARLERLETLAALFAAPLALVAHRTAAEASAA